MFIVDDSFDLEALEVLAAHAKDIDPRVRDLLEEHWTGDKPLEFLAGLLVGYTNAHAIQQIPDLAVEEVGRPVGTVAAFVAEKLVKQLR